MGASGLHGGARVMVLNSPQPVHIERKTRAPHMPVKEGMAMARYNPHLEHTDALFEAGENWKRRCFLEDGSLFSEEQLWSLDTISEAKRAFLDHLDESEKSFLDKLEGQLAEASPSARRLTAEMIWLLLLFSNNLKPETKRDQVRRIWSWGGEALADDHPHLRDTVIEGVGSAGTAFLTYRWRELRYFLEVAEAFKKAPADRRRQLLDDPWVFAAWLDDVPEEGDRSFRHILPFLLFPDHFERIASSRHKRAILAGLGEAARDDLTEMDPVAVDRALLDLRKRLEEEQGRPIDFYEDDLVTKWHPDHKAAAPREDMAVDEAAFEAMLSEFRARLPDFEAFDPPAGKYAEMERAYKDEFMARFAELAAPALEAPVETEADGRAVIDVLDKVFTAPLKNIGGGPQNMIGWRNLHSLRQIEGPSALAAAQAFQELWSGEETPASRLAGFARSLVPILEAVGSKGAKGAARSIGSLLLAVRMPKQAIFVRTNLWSDVTRPLLGETLFANRPITAEEYEEALRLARTVFHRLEALGWKPVDFWDVHHFFWVATQWPKYADKNHPPADMDEEEDEDAAATADPGDPDAIRTAIEARGLLFDPDTVLRYHLGLRTRNFVILAGDSGTGKTGLAVAYAEVTGAKRCVVPVAPNWTSNEDLLGFHNPIDDAYRSTRASRFLKEAAEEYSSAMSAGRQARAYHLVLDEMNLARVEYYFARLLSAMERRDVGGEFELALSEKKRLTLGPNLYVIGTVNVDETTHAFADKVYDRAQLIEIEPSEELIARQLDGKPYGALLGELWRKAKGTAPFAFRTLVDIERYVAMGKAHGQSWEVCLDHQFRQKILPKAKGADPAIEAFLEAFKEMFDRERFPLSHAKAEAMLAQYKTHGYASFF